jgi:putative flavoprotein involved in K+ transport
MNGPMIIPPQHLPVAVIGGGQAGLAISWYLKQQGIEHRVFERHGVAHEWRNARWDSFCLVTPNWQCRLPGFSYDKEFGGTDPKGFMLKDDIVRYLEAYVASFDPPLECGVDVLRVRAAEHGGFEIKTSKGDWTASQVCVAIGGYHLPTIPRSAERLPSDIVQLHSSNYRHPSQLPEGGVLVVGTGQSGCQIAEDLHREGRDVHLAVGTAPRSPRVYRGREVTEWLTDSGYYGISIDQHPQKETVREKTNHYLSGRDGGKEIDLRQFALEGMKLYGRFKDLSGTTVSFEPDLQRNLDRADDSYKSIRSAVDAYIAAKGIAAPVEAPFVPCWQPSQEIDTLDLQAAGITSVVWSIGFAADYRWLEAPVFDGRGHPVHQRGVSPVEGLYFLGLPWQNTWGSGRFADVGFDAEFLAQRIKAFA